MQCGCDAYSGVRQKYPGCIFAGLGSPNTNELSASTYPAFVHYPEGSCWSRRRTTACGEATYTENCEGKSLNEHNQSASIRFSVAVAGFARARLQHPEDAVDHRPVPIIRENPHGTGSGSEGAVTVMSCELFAEPGFNQLSSAKFNRLLDTIHDETVGAIKRQRPGIVLQHSR